MATRPWASAAPAEQIDQYRIVRRIGGGGMGEVFLARDMTLGRTVALKLLASRHAADPELRAQFLNEARLTAQLSHPNVVTLYGVGEYREMPYVALEYVDGQTLAERIRSGDRLETREVVRIGRGIARAIAAAHAVGVLHRDLKPSNVIIAKDGRPRVLDFGIAKFLDPDHDSLPREGATALPGAATADDCGGGPSLPRGVAPDASGTPAFMAPEQWAGFSSKATDLWALGVILFLLITRRHPYDGLEPVRLMAAVTSNEPVELPSELREIPTDLSTLVVRCLAKDPAERLAAAEAVELLEGLDVRGRPVAESDTSPYPGLAPFTEGQSHLFFGRDEEIDSFLERLREAPLLVLAGPSGAGKSSFVRAGVIPGLHAHGHWHVVRLRPGAHPLAALGSRLLAHDPSTTAAGRSSASRDICEAETVRVGTSEERAKRPVSIRPPALDREAGDLPTLTERLRQTPEALSALLHTIAARSGCRVLIFVDQLEELQTLCTDDEERRAFITAVCSAAIDALEPIRVVLSVRDDFLGRIPWGVHAQEALRSVTFLQVPAPGALRDTVVRPLRLRRYGFDDPSVVEEMIDAVQGEASCLPLLQFVLTVMWRQRDRERRRLLGAVYRASGGVAGALAEHAERVLGGMTGDEVRAARSIALRLVTAEGLRRPQPREALLDGLEGVAATVLERLTDARLLTLRRGSDATQPVRVELAHESLTTSWPRLVRWVQESRDEIGTVSEIREAAELWHRRGRRVEELWSGDALHDVARRLSTFSSPVPPVVGDFVRLGVERERRIARRRRTLRAALLTALAVATGASMLAAWLLRASAHQQAAARERAEQDRAQVLQEAAVAALQRGDAFEARALTRAALEKRDSLTLRMLWSALERDPLVWRRSMRSVVYSVAVSPDGRWLAAASQDRLLHLFDLASHEELLLRGHRDQVLSTAFSPTGSTLASGSWDGEIRLWDPVTRSARTLRPTGESATTLSFSHDGSLLVTSSHVGVARVYDVATGRELRMLAPASGKPTNAHFAPTGDRVALVGAPGVSRIVRATTGEELAALRADHALDAIGFSPDGRRLVTSTPEGELEIWDTASGERVQRLRGHRERVRAVVFSDDGGRVFSGGFDHFIREWDLGSGDELRALPSGHGNVDTLAVGQSGALLVSAGDYGVALWRSLDRTGAEATLLSESPRPGLSVAVSPNGQRVVHDAGEWLVARDVETGRVLTRVDVGRFTRSLRFDESGARLVTLSTDGRVRLYDAESGRAIREMQGQAATKGTVLFDGAADRILGPGPDGTIREWQASSGDLVRTLAGHDGAVFGLAGTADHQALGSAGTDGTIRWWSMRTGSSEIVGRSPTPLRGVALGPDAHLLAAASEDGKLVLVDLEKREARSLGPFGDRLYGIALHPARPLVAVASSDGSAYLVDLAENRQVRLRGHHDEVNVVAFGPNGEWLATTSDDATVRLWRTADGRPKWHGVGFLDSPLKTFSHLGWLRASDGSPTGPSAAWLRAVENARLTSRADGSLCLATFDGMVERWNADTGTRVASERVPDVDRLVTVKDGCVVLRAGEAQLVASPAAKRLAEGATAVARGGDEIFVAIGSGALIFDAAGAQQSEFDLPGGVTALLPLERSVAVGYAEGTIERRSRDGSTRTVAMAGTAAARVALLVEGPHGTVAAGYENGVVGLWDLESGERLEQRALHGQAVDMALVDGRLELVSELGDRATIDLRVLDLPYCTLLRSVWHEMPFSWHEGSPTRLGAPTDHSCAPP